MNALSLAFGMLVLAYGLLVEVHQKLRLALKACIDRDELDRVFTGRDAGQLFKQSPPVLGGHRPNFFVRNPPMIAT